jgi:hypothetical protein
MNISTMHLTITSTNMVEPAMRTRTPVTNTNT